MYSFYYLVSNDDDYFFFSGDIIYYITMMMISTCFGFMCASISVLASYAFVEKIYETSSWYEEKQFGMEFSWALKKHDQIIVSLFFSNLSLIQI